MSKKFAFFTFLIAFVMLSCSKDDNQKGGVIDKDLGSYPLSLGYSWNYQTIMVYSDSSTSEVLETDTMYSSWTVISDTLINGSNCKKVRIVMDDNNTVYHYYTNKSDGLYGVACQGMVDYIFLKDNDNLLKYVSFFNYNDKGIDTADQSVFVSPMPLYLVKTPYVQNEEWLSNEFNQSANVHRKWIAEESVLIKGKTYQCTKLSVNLNSDDSEIFQYYSECGFVKELQQKILRPFNSPTRKMVVTTELLSKNF